MSEKVNTKDHPVDANIVREGPRKPLHIVLDNIRSAFNVGSAFRTADATKVEKIHLCGISAKPPNAKLEKTALGSTQTVPWSYYQNTVDAVTSLKKQSVRICLVELSTNGKSLWEYSFPEPVALVFGHEVYGVGEELFPIADEFIYIPMHGKKTTLNVATSIGVTAFEVLRQWQLK